MPSLFKAILLMVLMRSTSVPSLFKAILLMVLMWRSISQRGSGSGGTPVLRIDSRQGSHNQTELQKFLVLVQNDSNGEHISFENATKRLLLFEMYQWYIAEHGTTVVNSGYCHNN